MDDDSGESAGEDEVADVGRDESELEWLDQLSHMFYMFSKLLHVSTFHRLP